MRLHKLSAVTLASAVLALAACGDDSASSSVGAAQGTITNATAAPAIGAAPSSSAPATSIATGVATTGAAATVPEVLRFQAARIGGGTVDAAAYAGKPVAFWFWAPG
ncbi:MAG: hypothetical protein ACKO91_09340 [Acidimicrobiales bacterium]